MLYSIVISKAPFSLLKLELALCELCGMGRRSGELLCPGVSAGSRAGENQHRWEEVLCQCVQFMRGAFWFRVRSQSLLEGIGGSMVISLGKSLFKWDSCY